MRTEMQQVTELLAELRAQCAKIEAHTEKKNLLLRIQAMERLLTQMSKEVELKEVSHQRFDLPEPDTAKDNRLVDTLRHSLANPFSEEPKK